MIRQVPTRFNPELLARNPEQLSVSFPLALCKRLTVFLAADKGELSADLRVVRVGRQLSVEGNFATSFTLECQRCLQPFEHPVEARFSFVLVTDEEAAEKTADGLDPVVLDDDGSIEVVALFEDELILQVPNVPKHESVGMCDFEVPVEIDQANAEPANPGSKSAFEVLKNLKFGDN